ncbi:MAG: hypothetical protein AAFP84_15890 [Actinomycetota bacterium]
MSVETRERIRSFGGETHEQTVIAALDALEASDFWTRAERAAASLVSQPDVRAAVDADAAEWDAAVTRW